MTPGMADTKSLCEKIREAQDCIRNAVDELYISSIYIYMFLNYLYTSGVEGLAFSYNGGKDCTVMLDLIHRTIPLSDGQQWPVCYVASKSPFPQVEDFIRKCKDA
jgi:3'-phosphoadenosine 5'-phosphosulfate sulfotransferase (PAPS reductase)/FAD synthetase